MATRRTTSNSISVSVTDSDIAECFCYNVGCAIRELAAAQADKPRKDQHLAQARTHLMRELERQPEMANENTLVDAVAALDMRPFAMVILAAYENDFLNMLFKPASVKDVRCVGQVRYSDITDTIAIIDKALNG